MTPDEYRRECEREARDMRRTSAFERKGVLYAIQALALVFLFIILVLVAFGGEAKAVIGPSNPTFGPPFQPFNPPPYNPPTFIPPPPGVLTPPPVPGTSTGVSESAESRERANYLQYRKQIWDLAYGYQQSTGVPSHLGAEYLDLLFDAQRPGRDVPEPPELESPAGGQDRPPIPGSRKKGEWPTCWVNNPPKTPWMGGMNPDGTPEILSGIFAGRCNAIVWETGAYACLTFRSSLGGPWRIASNSFHGCEAALRKGSDRVTLNVTVQLCPMQRRTAPMEWRITGHAWVNYAPPGMFAGTFYRSLTYSSESIVIPYRQCDWRGK